MSAIRCVIFVVFGLVFGSFLTVLVYRLPRRQSVIAPRSACPRCGMQLGAVDNIPVVSYLVLRGRCRRCGASISPEYPLTELATALLFLAAALTFDDTYVAAVVALFLAVMLAAALIDLRHRIIPNRLTYPSLLLGAAAVALMSIWIPGVRVVPAVVGMLSFAGPLLIVALVSGRGMGMGDVKLAALIGLVLGSLGLTYVAVAAGAAVLLGGIGGVVALLLGRSRKDAIPFGPYLAAGAMVAAVAAPLIADLYLQLVGLR